MLRHPPPSALQAGRRRVTCIAAAARRGSSGLCRLAGAAIVAAMVPAATAATMLDPADAPHVTAQMYRDEAANHPSLGQVTGSGLTGSGVALGGRWVLTAGHVSLSKTNGTFALNGESYTIQSVITHPSFSFSGPAYDLGLLQLDREVAGPPATMIRLGSMRDLLGIEAVWAGFGLGGTGITGAQAPAELRAFTNIIDVFGDHPSYGLPATSFVADFDKPDGTTNAPASSPGATRLEGNLAPGDSGGGVFIEVDGAWFLVGINSYTSGFAPGMNSRYGSLSGAANLHLFHDWIEGQTAIAPVMIPEPATALLFAIAAASLCLRRRQRPVHIQEIHLPQAI